MMETGKSVKGHMSASEMTFHWLMIFCTCGFWYPIYKSRKNKLERATQHYDYVFGGNRGRK